ncbi:CheF family chemotaxis protein [Halovenus salina]|uniref:CheF family chemotaxis protein n=1 Tax=Halovenus salina TaxID=1510225 RepID=UPI0022609F0B|nr:CheF family chemotaxis protein [Halovenus salina]
MSEGEQKLVDTAGDYLYAIKDGEPLPEANWRSCRVILTNERLVLSTNGGKQAIPYSNIRLLDDDSVLPAEHRDATATPLRIGSNVILVDAQQLDSFEVEFCRAALHDEVILARHPAKVGGVVQDEATWSKSRFRLDDETIVLGLPGNETVSFPIEDVGTIDTAQRQVMGEQRTVVEVEHTDEDERSVETHFSGTDWHTDSLEEVLAAAIEKRENDHELSEMESQVLMALYSGVSPFEMSGFVGIDVEEVEEIYQRLLETGAVDKVRERTEVSLNAHGRNLASEAMNER